MRLTPLLITALLAVAGCGGDEIAADEVGVSPPTITIPQSRDAGPDAPSASDGAAADETPDADATETPDATSGTSSGGTTGGTAGGATGGTGGGTTGGTQEPQQEQDTGSTGGAQADEGLDQFCADNPGAC